MVLVSQEMLLEHRARLKSIGVLVCVLAAPLAWCAPLSESAVHDTAHDIFKQLIEINTTDSIGSTTLAAQSYYQGEEFYYQFLKALTTRKH